MSGVRPLLFPLIAMTLVLATLSIIFPDRLNSISPLRSRRSGRMFGLGLLVIAALFILAYLWG